jgi:hypothetical protein
MATVSSTLKFSMININALFCVVEPSTSSRKTNYKYLPERFENR